MSEDWRPIPGWEGLYDISNQGRVLSRARRIWQQWNRYSTDGFWRVSKPRILKPARDRKGYLRVTLQRDGLKQVRWIHHLVLESFVGPQPAGTQACHYDDDPQNNRPENLRWDTPSANCADRTRNGGSPNALKTHCPQGHPYSPENTYANQGQRRCRTCHIRRSVERKRRLRQQRKDAA